MTTESHEDRKPVQPLGLGSSEGLGAGAKARKGWEPIGWGLRMYQRAETRTAHVWVQSGRYRNLAHTACGLRAVDQRELLPEGDAVRAETERPTFTMKPSPPVITTTLPSNLIPISRYVRQGPSAHPAAT